MKNKIICTNVEHDNCIWHRYLPDYISHEPLRVIIPQACGGKASTPLWDSQTCKMGIPFSTAIVFIVNQGKKMHIWCFCNPSSHQLSHLYS